MASRNRGKCLSVGVCVCEPIFIQQHEPNRHQFPNSLALFRFRDDAVFQGVPRVEANVRARTPMGGYSPDFRAVRGRARVSANLNSIAIEANLLSAPELAVSDNFWRRISTKIWPWYSVSLDRLISCRDVDLVGPGMNDRLAVNVVDCLNDPILQLLFGRDADMAKC